MRIGWVTCLVFQPKNHKPLRIFFCRHLFLRRGGSQFTQFYHCRNVIFFHNRPLFSNFQLFRALKTQLTFMAVGEPDYTPACLPTQLVLWSNRLLAAAAAIVHTHLFDLATGFSEVQKIVKGAGKQFCVWFLFVQGDISWGPGAGLEAPWFPPWFSAAWLLSSSSFCSPQVMLLAWPSGTELCVSTNIWKS